MILLPPARSFLIHIEKALAGRQHNDGKRSARCQGCERDLEGVKRSMVCCLAGALSLSALQDEHRTKQADVSSPAMWFGAQACARLLPSTFASSVKVSMMITRNQTVNNMTIITLLFKYYSVAAEVSSAAPQLQIYCIKAQRCCFQSSASQLSPTLLRIFVAMLCNTQHIWFILGLFLEDCDQGQSM
ncbi:hypothetical protein AMECASPLE_034347 [Ameca splendens]|uniref:Uncharacterized protein n=1 Tax=Ameca splendens TaxID=208324 RepID=A0ABV0YI52_9TELE